MLRKLVDLLLQPLILDGVGFDASFQPFVVLVYLLDKLVLHLVLLMLVELGLDELIIL